MSRRALQARRKPLQVPAQLPLWVAQGITWAASTGAACLATCLALLLLGLLAACANPAPPAAAVNPSYITLLANPDGSVGRVLVRGAQGEQQIAQAGFAALLDGSQAPAPVDAAAFQRDFAEAMAARPELPQHWLLYFESGSAQLGAESKGLLPSILAAVAQRASAELLIIGHADGVGSSELNQGLALQRAQAVADALKSRGLQVDLLTVASQGKRAPLVATPNDRSEARNRRVEVTVR